MCAAGIPKEDTSHALKLVEFARAMLEAMEELNLQNKANGLPTWDIRIGIHSGPLIAGVVGEKNSLMTFGEILLTLLREWRAVENQEE